MMYTVTAVYPGIMMPLAPDTQFGFPLVPFVSVLLFSDSTAAKRSFTHKIIAVAHSSSPLPLPVPERKTLLSSRPLLLPTTLSPH